MKKVGICVTFWGAKPSAQTCKLMYDIQSEVPCSHFRHKGEVLVS